MSRPIRHLRTNAVAYLALFVALGGTSYAAINLPPGSVGTKQIKNHAITPIKFDTGTIAGSVRYWAVISADGKVVASRPRARVSGWTAPNAGGLVNWGQKFPPQCFTLATVAQTGPISGGDGGFAAVFNLPEGNHSAVDFETYSATGQTTPERVNIAVVCPQP